MIPPLFRGQVLLALRRPDKQIAYLDPSTVTLIEPANGGKETTVWVGGVPARIAGDADQNSTVIQNARQMALEMQIEVLLEYIRANDALKQEAVN